MRVALPMFVGAAILIAAAACGGAAPPPSPVVNQDSIDAERRRQQEAADAAAREQARRDSIARAQQESERVRRQREADSLAALGRDADAVRAMVAQAINFDFDRAEIRAGMDAQTLDEKLRILQANPGLSIEIIGHADERGSDEYNLALGNRRAIAAKQYLTTRGIDPSRVATRSMGEEQPLDPGSTEDAWARNRRDEFGISAGGETLRRP